MAERARSIRTESLAEALAPPRGRLLCLLGAPAVLAGGRRTALGLRPKAIALVTYLALSDREVTRRELARLLFPGAEAPLGALRWHLAHLRAVAPWLGRCLSATRDGLRLQVVTDAARFAERAGVVVRRPDVRGAAGVLALYQGDLVAGVSVSSTAEFDNWLYVTQETLRRRFRQATLAFARWAVRHGRAREAIEPLARLVTVDPYCEDAHVQLIEAYGAVDEAPHARAAYDRYQRIVRRELAAEPRPALVAQFEGTSSKRATLPTETLVPVKNVTLHVVEWHGEEPAILAIHGSAQMAHSFGALAEGLAPTHRFVGVDLRGHGFSDKPPTGYDLDRHVDDVCQLIDALRLRYPIILGHSAGGAVAAFVAARANIAGLILLEAMIGDRAFTENAAAQAAPLASGLGPTVAGFDAYLAQWRTRRAPFSDEAERLAERWVRFALAPLPDGTYRQRALREAVEAEWASIIAANSLGTLAKVSCPILIVQALKPWIGGRPYFTASIVEAQRRAAPSAELFVAEASDHGTLIRDPEPAMVAAITRFVRRSWRMLHGR